MRSKHVWPVAFLVLIGFCAHRYFQDSTRPLVANPEADSAEIKVAREISTPTPSGPTSSHTEPRAFKAAAPLTAKPLTIESNSETELSDRNVANFKVEDGLAIAFGDVILGKPDKGSLNGGRAHVSPPSPWNSTQIPYFIAPEIPEPERIIAALDYFNKNTAVTFVPFNGQADVLVFQPGKGCKSYVGKIGGYQPIYLESKCGTHEVLHELMHALGFVHEQSRMDRDQFLKINWENIDEAHRFNFDIAPESYNSMVPDTGFDYQSIMLYPPHMFAKSPNLNAMEPRGEAAINPVTDGLSQGDLIRVEKLLH